MVYKYSIGDIVIFRETEWKVIKLWVDGLDRNMITIRQLEMGATTTIRENEPGLYLHESAPAPTPGIPDPVPRPVPTPPETIPGDRDGDYPVTEKGIMAVAIPFAMAGVVMYVVVKLIWR